jgi:hypothetical protein
VIDRPRISWHEAEVGRLDAEQSAMRVAAPQLVWDGTLWRGLVPVWPFDRDAPARLDQFLGDRRLTLEVAYYEAYPMVPPRFTPLDPDPDIRVRTVHAWHVNGDGSLCLFQNADDWDPRVLAAGLMPKASGWFLEYLLLIDGRIDSMTINGIANDDALDHLLTD